MDLKLFVLDHSSQIATFSTTTYVACAHSYSKANACSPIVRCSCYYCCDAAESCPNGCAQCVKDGEGGCPANSAPMFKSIGNSSSSMHESATNAREHFDRSLCVVIGKKVDYSLLLLPSQPTPHNNCFDGIEQCQHPFCPWNLLAVGHFKRFPLWDILNVGPFDRAPLIVMGFVEWSTSIQIPMLYLTICITIPSMALYIAEIVTILRHKKFHNSFFALFIMRAIADMLYELDSFYGYRLPSIFGAVLYPVYSKFPNWMFAMYYFLAGHTFQANNLVTIFILLNRLTAIIMPLKHEKLWRKLLPLLTIFVICVPILTCWPVFKMDGILQMKDPNSTTDRNFIISDAGNAPYTKYIAYIATVFSAIFMIVCVLINICTLVAYKFYVKKVDANWNNNGDEIEKKLLINAMTTFLGHALVASLFLILIITNNIHGPKTKATLSVYYPVIIDTGTVVLSSWLLLWTSGTLRHQLLKDFGIIRINNVQNIQVDAQEGHRNNDHWAIKV